MIWSGSQFLQKSVQCGEVSVETIAVQNDLKNEIDKKNKDNIKNDIENEDDLKNEEDIKNEDNLKWGRHPKKMRYYNTHQNKFSLNSPFNKTLPDSMEGTERLITE